MSTPPASHEPDVTVAVTNYNYGRYLGECARSVLTQEGVDVDLLIVDDASTDDSVDVIRELEVADPRVRVIRHAENSGLVAAVNTGVTHARGRAWMHLDADDVLTPGALHRAVAVLDAHPQVGFVYGRPLFFDDGDPLPHPHLELDGVSLWRGRDWFEGRCRSSRSVIASVEIVVRTTALREVGGMAPLKHTHDFELWARLAARWEVAHLDGVHQGFHRTHGVNMSGPRMDTPWYDTYDRAEGFATLFDSPAVEPALRERLEPLARRAVAQDALEVAVHAWNRGRLDREGLAEVCGWATGVDPGARRTRLGRAARAALAADPGDAADAGVWRVRRVVGAARRRAHQEFRGALLRRYGVSDAWSVARRRRLPPPPALRR